MDELNKLKIENEALKELMDYHQKIIAVMDNYLINKGVNFDFATVDEQHAKLKALSDKMVF